ncbi:MAG: hypothetical protein WC663_05345 [Patescibacteria group bacterium]
MEQRDRDLVKAMVNAYLDKMRAGSDPAWTGRKEKNALHDALYIDGVPIVYDEKNSAQSLFSQLVRFKKDSFDCYPRDMVYHFLYMLEYLQILEEDGINGLNKRIAILVDQLRTMNRDDYDGIRHICRLLDNLLQTVIYFCPHLVFGVELKLKSGSVMDDEAFGNLYGYEHNRWPYEKMMEMQGFNPNDSRRLRMVVNLPYSFTTGTHGSGERAAVGSSRVPICFGTLMYRERIQKNGSVPCVKISVKRPLLSEDYTAFAIDEVESVRLVPECDYIPYYSDFADHPEKEKLISRMKPEDYYLIFRDFSNYVNFRRDNVPSSYDLLERAAFLAGFCEPSYFCRLTELDYDRKSFQLGFIWEVDIPSHKPQVYEFWDIEKPDDDTHVALGMVYVAIKSLDQEVMKKVCVHEGIDIIRRLMQIPVHDRHF